MTWVALIQLFAIQPGTAETESFHRFSSGSGQPDSWSGTAALRVREAAFGKGNEHLEESSSDILDSAASDRGR